jgi:NADH-quinone oxidoreductase subunit J
VAQSILFYLFSTVLIFASAMVVGGRNPVHSVLFLILAFFNAAGLFLLAGAELLAMILIIVYVGSVAVLFLFMVMMLEVDTQKLRHNMSQYFTVGCFIGIILAVELVAVGWNWSPSLRAHDVVSLPIIQAATQTNTHAIGEQIYTHYFYIFQISGVILLVAMIGTIVLTIRGTSTAKKQNYEDQMKRNKENTLEIVKVPFKTGIKL